MHLAHKYILYWDRNFKNGAPAEQTETTLVLLEIYGYFSDFKFRKTIEMLNYFIIFVLNNGRVLGRILNR